MRRSHVCGLLATICMVALGCGNEARSLGSVDGWRNAFANFCAAPVREGPSVLGRAWTCEPATLPRGCTVTSHVVPRTGGARGTVVKAVGLLFSNCPVPDFLRAVESLIAPLVPARERAALLEQVLLQVDQSLAGVRADSWIHRGLEVSAHAEGPSNMEGLPIGRGSATISVAIVE